MKIKLTQIFIFSLLVYSCLNKTKKVKNNEGNNCLIIGYTTQNSSYKYVYTYNYNKEGKVVDYSYTTTNTPNGGGFGINQQYNIKYQENKENLGSDIKPYVTTLLNETLIGKNFCDKNGRTKREEIYSKYSSFPNMIRWYEYDSSGFNTKIIVKQQDNLGVSTGDSSINESEYSNENLIRTYITIYKKNVLFRPRSMIESFDITSIPIKSKIVFLFNQGLESKNYQIKKIYYTLHGTINTAIGNTYKYTFDEKGNILTKDIFFPDGTKTNDSNYFYQCK
jgi:hypothetical protein